MAPEIATETGQNPLMNAVATEAAPPTRGWSLSVSPLLISYPSRIYAVREIQRLRWERFNGRGFWQLLYDEATVGEELPAWMAFGPNGERVAEILEQTAALSVDHVRALEIAADLPRMRIPVELVDPSGHPLEKIAQFASSTAMVWMENRGWAADPAAGGHYYSGCYFVYNLSDPHWLAAMGRAMNAAIVAVLGSDVPMSDATRVRREWAELTT